MRSTRTTANRQARISASTIPMPASCRVRGRYRSRTGTRPSMYSTFNTSIGKQASVCPSGLGDVCAEPLLGNGRQSAVFSQGFQSLVHFVPQGAPGFGVVERVSVGDLGESGACQFKGQWFFLDDLAGADPVHHKCVHTPKSGVSFQIALIGFNGDLVRIGQLL